MNGLFGLGSSAALGAFETANELIGISGLMVRRFEVKTPGGSQGGQNVARFDGASERNELALLAVA